MDEAQECKATSLVLIAMAAGLQTDIAIKRLSGLPGSLLITNLLGYSCRTSFCDLLKSPEVLIRTFAVPIWVNGKVVRVIGFIMDITESRPH